MSFFIIHCITDIVFNNIVFFLIPNVVSIPFSLTEFCMYLISAYVWCFSFLFDLFNLFAFLMIVSQKPYFSFFSCVPFWCEYVHIYLCVHVKTRDEHLSPLLLLLCFETGFLLKYLAVSASSFIPAQGLQMHTAIPGFWSGVGGAELCSSCLYSRHFTHRAISPAQSDCDFF